MPLGARAAERRLPARAARRGDRHLQRDHRARRGAAARSSAAPSSQGIDWDVDLLAQRPHRPARRPARARAHATRASARARRSTCAGLALVTAGALALVWGLVRGNPAGWGSVEVVALAGGGHRCWRRPSSPGSGARAEPMLPMSFFRSRAFSAGNAAIFCVFASLFGGGVLLLPAAADRARLRPARGRPAAPAVDRHVPLSRRSPARSPTGSASGR